MPNAQAQKQALQRKLNDAAEALKTYQYVVLIQALIAIAELQRGLNLARQQTALVAVNMTDEQLFAFRVFQNVWNDDHDVKSTVEDKNAKYLAARASFSQERAEKVEEGLTLLKTNYNLQQQNAQVANAAAQNEIDVINLSAYEQAKRKNQKRFEDLEAQDKKAYEAILKYETKRQKAVRYVGYFLAGVCSFVFGAIETGVSVALLLPTAMPLYAFYIPAIIIAALAYKYKPVQFKRYFPLIVAALVLPMITSLAMVYIPAIGLSVLATWLNWMTFKPYVPSLLKKIMGKDQYFDGITSYVDPKTGDKVNLSKNRLLALAIFSGLALLTGAAIGALGYGGILQTVDLPFLGAFFGTISTALGPIGIGLAVIVAATITLMLTKGFSDFLQNKKLRDGFKKHFNAVSDVLEKNGAGLLTKGVVWFSTGLLAVVGLLGLGFACYSASKPLGKFFIDQFGTAPQIAQNIANVIAYGAAFLSRFWFTLRNMVDASKAVLNRVYAPKKTAESTIEGNTQKPENNKSVEKIVVAVVEAASEGLFYEQLDVAGGTPLLTGISAGVLAGTRSFGANAAHVDEPDEDPFEVDACHIAAAKRQDKFMKTYGAGYVQSSTFFAPGAQAARNAERQTRRDAERLPENDSRFDHHPIDDEAATPAVGLR